jgi:hypothetical protein
VEGVRLGLRPDFLFEVDAIGTGAKMLDDRPLMLGRSCRSIELPIRRLAAPVICRLVVDPSRNHQVVRASFRTDEGTRLTQYDIEYDQDESSVWWPQAVTLIQFNGFGDPYDQLRMVRRKKTDNPNSTPGTVAEPPAPGTWVIDQIASRQYMVGSQGEERPVAVADAAAKLLPLRSGPRSKSNGVLRTLEGLAVRLVSWPWVLMTVAVVYVIGTWIRWRRSSRFRPARISHTGSGATARELIK